MSWILLKAVIYLSVSLDKDGEILYKHVFQSLADLPSYVGSLAGSFKGLQGLLLYLKKHEDESCHLSAALPSVAPRCLLELA